MSISEPAPAARARSKRVLLGLAIAVLAITVVAPAAGAANPKTKRVAVHTNGTQGNGTSWLPSSSADGRFVAFESTATNLVGDDGNGVSDIFVRDREKKRTRRVSVSSSRGEATGGHSYSASISPDGRFVAFESAATNLVRKDTNDSVDIFVRDRKTGKTKRVSIRIGGGQATASSKHPSISANGRFVAFQSQANDLVGGDSNGKQDIFVHDRWKKKTRRVNVKSNGGQAIGENSFEARISGNGRYVAFWSNADTLVNNDALDSTSRRNTEDGVTSNMGGGSSGEDGPTGADSPAEAGDVVPLEGG